MGGSSSERGNGSLPGQRQLVYHPRSADGHYWIPAFINGFPVTFLLETVPQYIVDEALARISHSV